MKNKIALLGVLISGVVGGLPVFADTCVDFSGGWKGSCQKRAILFDSNGVNEGQAMAIAVSIKQDGCKHFIINDSEFMIDEVATMKGTTMATVNWTNANKSELHLAATDLGGWTDEVGPHLFASSSNSLFKLNNGKLAMTAESFVDSALEIYQCELQK